MDDDTPASSEGLQWCARLHAVADETSRLRADFERDRTWRVGEGEDQMPYSGRDLEDVIVQARRDLLQLKSDIAVAARAERRPRGR